MEPSPEQRLAEKAAVIERTKAYIGLMRQDKRMRILAGILLEEIERIEKDEAAKTARGQRP